MQFAKFLSQNLGTCDFAREFAVFESRSLIMFSTPLKKTTFKYFRPQFARSHGNTIVNLTKPRVLITGGFGQIGVELFSSLVQRYGPGNFVLTLNGLRSYFLLFIGNVILSDISSITGKTLEAVSGTKDLTEINPGSLPFRFVDVMDENSISKVISGLCCIYLFIFSSY